MNFGTITKPHILLVISLTVLNGIGCSFIGGDTASSQIDMQLSTTARNYHNYSPIEIEISFSEEVSSFTADDINVSNGTVTRFESEDGSPSDLYSADITPDTNGLVEIYVNEGVVSSADDDSNAASNIITIDYYAANHGRIVDLVASSSAETVYAVDDSQQKLWIIDLTKPGIVNSISLERADPRAAELDTSTNTLYLLNKFGPSVDVYNLDTFTKTDTYSTSGYIGQDLQLAPATNKAFVLAYDENDMNNAYLTVVDTSDMSEQIAPTKLLDTSGSAFGLISSSSTSEKYLGNGLALDPATETAYVTEMTFSPSSMYEFDASGSSILQATQELWDAGSNGYMIDVSPDGSRLVRPSGGGNSDSGYTIYDYSTADFSDVKGEWDVGTSPDYAIFSNDGSKLYASNGDWYDEYLYVMDADESYQQIAKYEFPNAGDYSRIEENADGTWVVGASYDSYDGDEHRLYYFDIE